MIGCYLCTTLTRRGSAIDDSVGLARVWSSHRSFVHNLARSGTNFNVYIALLVYCQDFFLAPASPIFHEANACSPPAPVSVGAFLAVALFRAMAILFSLFSVADTNAFIIWVRSLATVLNASI